MDILITILLVLFGIVNICCFIAVLISLWQENMLLGIACLVGLFITGIGGLILYVWGWFQSEHRPTMITWTISQVIFTIIWMIS